MITIIEGIVVKGEKISRNIGYRTANIELQDTSIEDGVYKVNILYDGRVYHGVGSCSHKKEQFETHIFDFNKKIYGERIEVVILKKVRDNMKFDDRDAVKKQIAKDIKKAKQDLLVVVTFGTFDGVHPGHEYYLSEAKKYGDRLITIIGTDKNVAKIKGRPPKKSQFERMSKVLQLGLSDGVIIGDEEDPFKFIGFYQPWVIALGYDQAGFAEHLEEYLEHQKLDTQILRIEPYKPEKYKSSLIN